MMNVRVSLPSLYEGTFDCLGHLNFKLARVLAPSDVFRYVLRS